MRIEDIKLRIVAAEAKMAKAEQTIIRLEKQRSNKLDRLLQMGVDPRIMDINDVRNNEEAFWTYCEYQDKGESISNNIAKIEEIKASITKYQEQLNTELAREAFLRNDVPQTIRDFFEMWKSNAYQYIQARYDSYQDFKVKLAQELRAARIEAVQTLPEYERLRAMKSPELLSDYELSGVYPIPPMDRFLKERHLDSRSIARRKQDAAGPYVTAMLKLRTPEERAEWLEKELEAEKRERILELCDRVGKIVGKITDSTNLSLQNGEICGIIIGEQGAASIQTIGAGGHTIQCFHYRTLVHEVDAQMYVYDSNDSEYEEDCDMEM